MRKLTKENFNFIYQSTIFISGIILIILGKTLIKEELIFSVGLGLFVGGLIISMTDFLMSRI